MQSLVFASVSLRYRTLFDTVTTLHTYDYDIITAICRPVCRQLTLKPRSHCAR